MASVQDHVELQSADHKWQKWEMREGEGTANEGQHLVQSGLHACPHGPTPTGKPTFPTSIGHIGRGRRDR